MDCTDTDACVRYGRILKRILNAEHPCYEAYARKLLAWLVCAYRSLKWYEIQAAISIDGDEQTVDIENRGLVFSAKELCGSLVEEGPNSEIVLVHTSAKL